MIAKTVIVFAISSLIAIGSGGGVDQPSSNGKSVASSGDKDGSKKSKKNPDDAACSGCGYMQTQTFCPNCTVAIIWGADNDPGECKQVSLCDETKTPCHIGSLEVQVTATTPGCKIQWRDPTDDTWDTEFKVVSGTVSHVYDDLDKELDCGTYYALVSCDNGSTAGYECLLCTGT